MHRALLFAFVVACGGGDATSAPADHPAVTKTGAIADPCWPVAAMRISVDGKIVAEMQGDGSMYATGRTQKYFAGRIANDAVLDAHDTPSMTCIHKEIDIVGGAFKGKYDERDAFVDANMKIEIGDDGAITFTGHAPTRWRVEGITPRTRRTAVIFVMSVLPQYEQ